jgi:hypothetical protein
MALAVLGPGGVVALGAADKTTVFHGRIIHATRAYAGFRGAVRLVLTSTGEPTPGPLGNTLYPFTLTIRGSKCSRTSPRRCVRLLGTVQGTAFVLRFPDGSAAPSLIVEHGRVSPLAGDVFGGGVIENAGSAVPTRMQLILIIRTNAGAIRFSARSPILPASTSPF